MSLKTLRKEKNLTQIECAKYLGMPVRTYQNYENEPSKVSTMKYQFIFDKLKKYGYIDETHGILTLKQITDICNNVFKEYAIEYCYLFGSYAKNRATENSDVDLFISSSLSGMKFYELVEVLREKLHKKVDVITVNQLQNNTELMLEILKDGIKIYEQ